jgi:hypothetical protein
MSPRRGCESNPTPDNRPATFMRVLSHSFSKRQLVPLAILLTINIWSLCAIARADGPDFNRDVAPILVKRCLECHNDREAAGEFVMTSRERAMAGGSSGADIVASSPDESLLVQRVADGEMPPEKKGRSQKLPDAEILVLRQWIASGASWPEGRTLDPYEQTTDVRAGRDWWSLQPLQRVTPPTVKDETNVGNVIDRFILAKLEANGMRPSPTAERRALLRRISYDVIGLPPTLEEISSFENDPAPDAYQRVADRLLSSPHFGERWARHWLDVVRFAETSGYERDQEKPGAWRYRDWVASAMNDDMPYDQFVLRQLAGDELPNHDEQSIIATGFLRLGTWNDEPNDPEEYKYERLEDMVHVTTSAFLASTAKCARCHDHKFDPIPQTDYYRLAAVFWPGPIAARQRELLGGPTAAELGFDVLGWTDLSSCPEPLHLLKKGDPNHPLQVVDAGVLSFVPALDHTMQSPAPDCKTTMRRTQLAQWIVDPQNPLTARVIVNRLWLYHFGQGLVRSPNDFGFNGDKPSHPELLDWLAGELIRSGWSLKHVHRLILSSRTYQQSSVHPEELAYRERDAENRFWWRAERRRLDAEQLRDSLLSASNQLDLQLGGPSFRPTISPEALEGLSRKGSAWTASPPAEQRRRSFYIYTQRSLLVPMLTTFDFADTTLPCGRRDVTTVAPQALALLNNPFVHEQSKAIAERILKENSSTDRDRARLTWRFTLGREPTPTELNAALEHLQVQQQNFAERHQGEAPLLALVSLCHVLLNSNEFIYVD